MKYADINKKFTEVVTGWMLKGYTINTASMGGSQGEVAKVDLTNGKEIIRVYMASFTDWSENVEGYEIIVGKSTDDVKPNTYDWGTIWMGHLEVIESIRFYKIGRNRSDFYGTFEEAKAATDLRCERYRARYTAGNTVDITDKAMEIANKIIRREFGVKHISEADIKATRRDGRYTISYKNKSYKLH